MSGPECTCSRHAWSPSCPVHGNDNQLELQDDPDQERDEFGPVNEVVRVDAKAWLLKRVEESYDPATSPWPEGY